MCTIRPVEVAPAVPLLSCTVFEIKNGIIARREQLRLHHPSGRYPTDQSVGMHMDRVSILHKHMHGCAWSDLAWARETESVLAYIDACPHWKTEASRNAHRNALVAVLRHMHGFEAACEVYSSAATRASGTIRHQAGDNKLNASQHAQYIQFDEMLEATLKCPVASHDSALMAVYTMRPPRRLGDYCLMRLTHEIPTDVSCNWVRLENNTPVEFTFNVYKTSAAYGQQSFLISGLLQSTLRAYIDATGLQHLAPLFPNRKMQFHTNFSRLVSTTFKRHTGKRISVDLLRHAFITAALEQRPTVNDRRALATAMAHSIHVQSLYEVLSDADDAPLSNVVNVPSDTPVSVDAVDAVDAMDAAYIPMVAPADVVAVDAVDSPVVAPVEANDTPNATMLKKRRRHQHSRQVDRAKKMRTH
jgi:hypothetical protein